jgi:hypothetical protein
VAANPRRRKKKRVNGDPAGRRRRKMGLGGISESRGTQIGLKEKEEETVASGGT